MKYFYDNTLNSDKFGILKKTIGKELSSIYTETLLTENINNPNNAHILLSFNDSNLSLHIKEEYSVFKGSNEEFTCFDFDFVDKKDFIPYAGITHIIEGKAVFKPFSWNKFRISGMIECIEIFRDYAEWDYGENTWNVISDVAIKFKTHNDNILMLLTDISPLYIPIYINSQKSEFEIINSIWNNNSWGILGTSLKNMKREKIKIE